MKLFKNNQTGRSMVEMLGVLAIIGVLSVGGIAGYSKAMLKHKISQMLDMVSSYIARWIEVDSANNSTIVDAYGQMAQKFGFDCDYDKERDICKHPFGHFGMSFNNKGGVFMVQFDGDTAQTACVELLSSEYYKNIPDDWWYPKGHIYVYNGTDYEYFYGKSEYALGLGAKPNVTAEDISRACYTCRDINDGYEPSCRVMLYTKNEI